MCHSGAAVFRRLTVDSLFRVSGFRGCPRRLDISFIPARPGHNQTGMSMERPHSKIGEMGRQRRWSAIVVLFIGSLMTILDTSIVSIALPFIRMDLNISEESLLWVVDAYLATFGGFLLIGGRLGDILGRSRVFLLGTIVFTAATLACGLAHLPWELLAARTAQGLGAGLVSVQALTLIVNLFELPADRARALGVYSVASVMGGTIGLAAGGILISLFSWRSVFFVNLPVGLSVYIFGIRFLPKDRDDANDIKFEWISSMLITGFLISSLYTITNGGRAGLRSVQTIGGAVSATLLLASFLWSQARAAIPLIPKTIIRAQSFTIANLAGAMWSAGMLTCFFFYPRYLQLALGYDGIRISCVYILANICLAPTAVFVAPRLISNLGSKRPLIGALSLSATGMALLASTPANDGAAPYVLTGMTLIGFGNGITGTALTITAMNGISQQDSGSASGIIRTASVMGGAIGLTLLARIAADRTSTLIMSGVDSDTALQLGYQCAMWGGAAILVATLLLSTSLPGR
jgi:MFS family permease